MPSNHASIARVCTLLAVVVIMSACDSDKASAVRTVQATADAGPQHADVDASQPLSPGKVGERVADYLLSRWPELDATPEDCRGPEDCFSLNFASVPAGPAPKFWEYTYGVPLVGVQKLYEKTQRESYLAFVRRSRHRLVLSSGRRDGRSAARDRRLPR
jgi:hypothetical protein